MIRKKVTKKVSQVVLAAIGSFVMISGCGNADGDISSADIVDSSVESQVAEVDKKSETADENAIAEISQMEITRTIKLDKSNIQIFNDTNGDGYGEFEGWGTSLCWWANRVGYSDELTTQAAEAFFNAETGLGMNIGRYNIGGGDNVTTETITDEMKEENPFIHEDHIRRSDSIVPGYATDVTKIDLDKNNKEYYEENFERADFECGFAWNYNWDADENQMNVLKAAMKESGEVFIAEAFSNSPPYFMTVSGCTSGNEDSAEDNLREDSVNAFATYITDVMEHWKEEGIVDFQSVSPMNEPATSYWGAFSEKQEGCHYFQGESQSRVLVALDKALSEKNLEAIVCGTDETNIDTAITSFDHLTDEAKEALDRIDTHSYQGTMRNMLRTTAQDAGKNLWMSEVDGTFSIGKKDTGMSAALGFADAIRQDLNGLMPSAWIMWDAVDLHVDSDNQYDTCTRAEADAIIAEDTPFWGIAIANHDTQELLIGKKYYAFGQFTRFIRPGYCLVGSSDFSVAAYNPDEKKLVIVAINTNSDDVKWEFDYSDFDVIGNTVTAIRTSSDENWADVTDVSGIENNAATFTSLIKGSSITTFVVE